MYWHQHQLFCGKYLLEQSARGLKLGFLISPSVDGEIGVMVVAHFGGHVIRGSATHTGARALRDFYDALVKQGVSPAMTPDGPKGPRFVFKPGAILLSQMSQRPILPMAYAASRATLFHWDKFVLPWPFSRIVIAVGAPRQVPRALQPAALEALQKEMAAEMKDRCLSRRAMPCATAARDVELSVVVPVCNEAENVEPLAREIHAALKASRLRNDLHRRRQHRRDGGHPARGSSRATGAACVAAFLPQRPERRGGQRRARRARRLGGARSTATDRTIRPTFRS